jgi:hypothetical protein
MKTIVSNPTKPIPLLEEDELLLIPALHIVRLGLVLPSEVSCILLGICGL